MLNFAPVPEHNKMHSYIVDGSVSPDFKENIKFDSGVNWRKGGRASSDEKSQFQSDKIGNEMQVRVKVPENGVGGVAIIYAQNTCLVFGFFLLFLCYFCDIFVCIYLCVCVCVCDFILFFVEFECVVTYYFFF